MVIWKKERIFNVSQLGAAEVRYLFDFKWDTGLLKSTIYFVLLTLFICLHTQNIKEVMFDVVMFAVLLAA